jgi:hypothetical protein
MLQALLVTASIGELARRRVATPLVIVPQFGSEDEVQQTIRRRILADDIPTVMVPLGPDWRLAWDRHPNADAAPVMAAAIAARLQPRKWTDHRRGPFNRFSVMADVSRFALRGNLQFEFRNHHRLDRSHINDARAAI